MADKIADVKTITVDGDIVAYVPESLSYPPYIASTKTIMDTTTNLTSTKYEVKDLSAETDSTVSFQMVSTLNNKTLFEAWRKKHNEGGKFIINLFTGTDLNEGISFTLDGASLVQEKTDIMKEIFDVSFKGNEVK